MTLDLPTRKCFPFSPLAAVRSVFPSVSNDEAGHLLWNHTGWPAFWRTGNAERDIKHSLRQLKRTLDAGKRPCEHCNRAADSPHDKSMCRRCSRALARAGRHE